MRWLPRFEHGNHNCRFPDRGNLGSCYGTVEGFSQILDPPRAKLLQVPGGEAVGTSSGGVFGFSDGLCSIRSRERCEIRVERELPKFTLDLPKDFSGAGRRRILAHELVGGILWISKNFPVEFHRLVRRNMDPLTLEVTQETPMFPSIGPAVRIFDMLPPTGPSFLEDTRGNLVGESLDVRARRICRTEIVSLLS